MTREIPLTRGYVALVDDADFERVNAFKWFASTGPRAGWYGVRRARVGESTSSRVYLHRFILNAPAGTIIDHRNGNGLDCRRANMRECTAAENAQNKRAQGNLAKGVRQAGRRFRAQIRFNKKAIYLGRFDTEIEAALAYDAAAKRFFGEFARLNFPGSGGHANVT